MTDITVPNGDTKEIQGITLNSGDTLIVNSGGIAHNITVNDAKVTVNGGAIHDMTLNDGAFELVQDPTGRTLPSDANSTINQGAEEIVEFGTVTFDTVNGGFLIVGNGSVADGTRLNAGQNLNARFQVQENAVARDTIIEGGPPGLRTSMTLDHGATAVNITYDHTHDPLNSGGTGVVLQDPLELKGNITGISVGDVIQFGDGPGVPNAPSVDVTSFEVTKNNDLIITYNNNLHATYHLVEMQPHTTFKLDQSTLPGPHFSTLSVVHSVGETPPVSAAAIESDHLAITRTELPPDQATSIANSINAGTQTEAQFVADLLSQVADTTIPAVAIVGSMYNAVGSSAEITTLVTQLLPPQIDNATQHGLNSQVYSHLPMRPAGTVSLTPLARRMRQHRRRPWVMRLSQRQQRTQSSARQQPQTRPPLFWDGSPIGKLSTLRMAFPASRMQPLLRSILPPEGLHGAMRLALP